MSPTKHLLTNLFDSLDENLAYVVLRNYDSLPEVSENDVDILVENGEKFDEILRAVAEDNGWLIRKRVDRYAFQSYQLINLSGRKTATVKIDIWFPLSWKGIEWIDSNYILKNRDRHPGGFYVPPAGAEAATLILKDLLQHGEIQQRYRDRIQELIDDDENGFKTVLTSKFNSGVVESLLDQIREGRWERIESQANQVRWNLLKSHLSKPQSAIKNLSRFFYGHLSDYLGRDPDTVVAFIGPDGSGKSTFSSKIIKSFGGFFDETEYYHGQFNILPQLKSFVPSKLKPENVEDQLRAESESNSTNQSWKRYVIHQGLMCYYGLDFIMGSLLLSCRRETKLVVFDRYFYDFVIQPRPIEFDDRLFYLLRLFIPTPDIIIYPYAPPKVILERKAELDQTEIKRQASNCARIVKEEERAQTINNADSMDESIKRIIELVSDHLCSVY